MFLSSGLLPAPAGLRPPVEARPEAVLPVLPSFCAAFLILSPIPMAVLPAAAAHRQECRPVSFILGAMVNRRTPQTLDETYTPVIGVLMSWCRESGFHLLEESQRVEFDITQGPRGLQAESIRAL
jgi:hypothetical protein